LAGFTLTLNSQLRDLGSNIPDAPERVLQDMLKYSCTKTSERQIERLIETMSQPAWLEK
jgi:hypothetical protein